MEHVHNFPATAFWITALPLAIGIASSMSMIMSESALHVAALPIARFLQGELVENLRACLYQFTKKQDRVTVRSRRSKSHFCKGLIYSYISHGILHSRLKTRAGFLHASFIR